MIKSIKPLLLLFVCFAISSCNHNRVDALLDDYDKIVTKWEGKAKKDGKLSSADFDEMGKDFEKLADQQKGVGKETKDFTPEQTERLTKLSQRMMALTMQAMPSLSGDGSSDNK